MSTQININIKFDDDAAGVAYQFSSDTGAIWSSEDPFYLEQELVRWHERDGGRRWDDDTFKAIRRIIRGWNYTVSGEMRAHTITINSDSGTVVMRASAVTDSFQRMYDMAIYPQEKQQSPTMKEEFISHGPLITDDKKPYIRLKAKEANEDVQ
jgi:hypothetical protein